MKKRWESRQARNNQKRSSGMSECTPFDVVYVYRKEEIERGILPKFALRWMGPCYLLRRLSDHVREVRLVIGKTTRIHVDRLGKINEAPGHFIVSEDFGRHA